MSKSKFFTGQPIFSQVLSFVPKTSIDRISSMNKADRYYKHFTTHAHLVSMLYGILNNCSSLREVTTGMLAWEHRINHLGIKAFPRRSTLSDANSRRSESVFAKIYQFLYDRHRRFLPDSRKGLRSRLYIADSTTISLFSEVLSNAGRPSSNGRRKGGIKVHTLIKSDEDVPCLIRYSSAASHDAPFLKDLKLPEGSIIVFDKGYNNYDRLSQFENEKVTWVTRKRKGAVFKAAQKFEVSEHQKSKGVHKDRLGVLGHTHYEHPTVKCRMIHFIDPQSGKKFQFITNNTKLAAATIASIYQRRWQIEILFKRLKQNYPLKYFLGDSENAIKIQIWCALIADLLIKLIKAKAARKWSFSNLTSIIRIHLMTYIDLFAFLKKPDQALQNQINKTPTEWNLFPT
ncbi:IS4 family transposase [Chryseolinea sp. T2]|uniref:IS4 family transposase n=1 Tax=Chryseolinea sp. T2 TaxID=3129255 RepID=UPI0030778E3C